MSKTDDAQPVTRPGFSALKPTPFSQYAGLWGDNQGEDPATIKVRVRCWLADGRRA